MLVLALCSIHFETTVISKLLMQHAYVLQVILSIITIVKNYLGRWGRTHASQCKDKREYYCKYEILCVLMVIVSTVNNLSSL